MTMIPHPKNSAITDNLKEAFEESSVFEIRLATAMLYYPERKDALAAINADLKLANDELLWVRVNKLLVEIRKELVSSSHEMMKNHLPQAVQVLMAGMNSTNEKVRLQTARYIVDRFMGKPTTHSVLDVKTQTETVHYVIEGINPDSWDVVDGQYQED